MKNKKIILFVCGGNTCRSPLAEVIAKKRLSELSLDEKFTADSAGIAAAADEKASNGSVNAAKKMGLDLSGHKAKQLDENLIDTAFKIVPMTARIYNMLLSLSVSKDKLILPPSDIPDPFMQPDEVYYDTAKKISVLCDYVTEVITS